MPDQTFVPVAQYLAGLWPSSVLPLPNLDLLDDIWMEPPDIETEPNTTVATAILFESSLEVGIPGVDAIRLVVAPSGTATAFMLRFTSSPTPAISLVDVPIALRFSRDVLQPARQGQADANGVSAWEPDPTIPFVDLQLAAVTLTIDFDGNVSIATNLTLNLPPALIGQSGVAVEAQQVAIFLDGSAPPPGKPAGWRGVHVQNAAVHLPSGLSSTVGTLSLSDAYIGNGGFSGQVSVDWNPALDATIGGMHMSLAHAGVTFVQNALTEAEIRGTMQLPFFDQLLEVSLSFGLDGNFAIALTGGANGLVTLTKPGILEIQLESLGFAVEEGVFVARLSGSLRPLFGGLDWPGVRVQELSIDSEGHVRLEGGWLDLRDQYHLDLFGFQLEITRLGLGSSDDGGKWIGFSGGLKLVDGMRAGASVDGLRLTWYEDGRSPSLTLEGVGVEFEVPGVIRFQGEVSYRDLPGGVHRFDGDIHLELISLDLEIDGQLVIGYDSSVGYSFFAIYLGVELPAGIPLWTTGLGLYGLAGLFALNMEPDKQANEPWYGMAPTEGWYKRPQLGVSDLEKWRNELHSVGIGAGVTIGTVADNGFTFAGRFLLVLVFPGPILLIEGKANILKARSSLADDPLLRALVVLDGRAGTFTIGLDAHYAYGSSGELIDINASAEAFFSFTDPMAWHLYLGLRDPRERRIRAAIFERLFEANAYFMLDAHQLALGAFVGYSKSWDFGPVHAGLEAWIEGNAVLSFSPAHFHGDLWLHGRAELSVFGFGFDISADARVAADVFDPFSIRVELSAHLGLPWPLPDFDVDMTLQWGPDPVPPPLPVPLKEIAIENFKVTTSWPLPLGAGLVAPGWADGDGMLSGPSSPVATVAAAAPPGNAPVVPLDARPHLTFSHTVHDDALVGGNPQPPLPSSQPESGWEWIGDTSQNQGPARMRIGLAEVALERWSTGNSTWIAVARRGPGANPAGVSDLFGSWAPVPQLPSGAAAAGSAAIGQSKLWLWSRSPFDFARHTSAGWTQWWVSQFPSYPCVPIPEDEEICCDFGSLVISSQVQSPVACPDAPWIALGWPSNEQPSVEEFAGKPAVCFSRGETAELHFGRAVKEARLFINTDRPDQQQDNCLDLRKNPQQEMPNPSELGSFGIDRRDAAGDPEHTVQIVPGLGLFVGWGARIRLAKPAETLELTIRSGGAPVLVTALDAEGTELDRQEGDGDVTFQFADVGLIAALDVEAKSGEAFLFEVCPRPNREKMRVVGLDWTGRELMSTDVENGVAVLGGRKMGAVRLEANGQAFCITGYCVVVGLSDEERLVREQMNQHLVEETARWTGTGFVLQPFTGYRLKVVTTLRTADFQYASSFNTTRTQTAYAYFRTDGPPGIASLSVPVNSPDPATFESGLDDLVRYVSQTVPPTVPRPGEQPPLPRPVYRAYDVGVAFNEDYVDQLYRASGRDLSMYLYDNNNRPARDDFGRLLVSANRWGRTEQLTLTETDRQWIDVVNASNCATIDSQLIEHGVALGREGQVLSADTLYEARLVPMLLHEGFASNSVGQMVAPGSPITGPMGGWQAVDSGTTEGPSKWVIGSTGNPPARYIEQQSNIWGGPDVASDPTNPGTILLRTGNPLLAAAHPDQPVNWTDYRLTAVLRSHDNDATGLVVRYRDASNYYLFAMDQERSYRRLIRVQGGTYTVIAHDSAAYDLDSDMTVSIECSGSQLRVFVDGELVFDAADSAHASGAPGLYSWANTGARFADIRIDDFRATAPVPYRFSFTTSRFSDLYHQMLSGTGDPWSRLAGDIGAVAAASSAAVVLAPALGPSLDTEQRAYLGLAEQAVGTASRADAERVDASVLEAGGSASALIVRTAEPVDWSRTDLSVARAAADGSAAQPMAEAVPAAGRARIADWSASPAGAAAPAAESVTLLLREHGSVEGWRIQYRVLPSLVGAAASDGSLLFEDQFVHIAQSVLGDGPPIFEPPLADLSDFTIEDPFSFFPSNSAWAAANGLVTQSSAIGGFGAGVASPGTLALCGDDTWRDIAILLRLRTDVTAGAVGLHFRHIDESNFYRFSMSPTGAPGGPYRRLVKRDAAGYTVLWQDTGAVSAATDYDLRIEVVGGSIRIELDGVELCNIRDSDQGVGRIALYSYRCSAASFSKLQVSERAASLDTWRLVERGPIAAAAAWSREGGALRQGADVGGPSAATADPAAQGAFAVADMAAAADVRIKTRLFMENQDAAGVVLHWQSVDDFELVVFDARSNIVSLVSVEAGVGSTVWDGPAAIAIASWNDVEIEAIGTRVRAVLNGAVVCDALNSQESMGMCGVMVSVAAGTAFSALRIESAKPQWEDYTTLTGEPLLAAGRRIRVFAGQSQDVTAQSVTAEVRRYLGHAAGDQVGVRLPEHGVDLRLVDPHGVAVHATRMASPSAFTNEPVHIARAPDGTGFAIVRPDAAVAAGSALVPGLYRLSFTFRRDNTAQSPGSLVLSENGDTAPELVLLDFQVRPHA